MPATKTCKKCGELKPLTTAYFNLLSSGHWRGTCKLCMAENTRRHYELVPEKLNLRVSRYKAQKAAAGGHYNDQDIANIRQRLRDRCAYCGVALNGSGEIDHIIPVSRGGDNSPTNLTLACLTCNRDKHAKTAQEYLTWRRRLGLSVRQIKGFI